MPSTVRITAPARPSVARITAPSRPSLVRREVPGIPGPEGHEGPIGPPAPTGIQTYPVTVATGQTVFPLPTVPTLLSSVALIINGTAYRWPDIAASAVAVTWLSQAFTLDAEDVAFLTYA